MTAERPNHLFCWSAMRILRHGRVATAIRAIPEQTRIVLRGVRRNLQLHARDVGAGLPMRASSGSWAVQYLRRASRRPR
jgi:hypothetical protein